VAYEPGPGGEQERRGGPERRAGGGVPDGLLIAGVLLLISLATLTWTATGLAGVIAHGRWPEGVSFVRTGTAVRSFLTEPRDVAGAWPETPTGQLPSATVLWLVFLTQLVMLFSTALVIAMRVERWRVRRRARAAKGEAEAEEEFSFSPIPPLPGTEALPQTPAGGLRPPGLPEEELPEVRPEARPEVPAAPGAARVPRDAVDAVVDGPEGLVVIDPDGGLWAKTARQRGKSGPVHVYDPGHVTDAPVRLRWAPQRGCGDMAVARRRAAALLAPVRPTEPIFQLDAETAETLLRCYLHAAALAGEPIQQVLRWAHGHAANAPAKILRTHSRVAPGASMELESALTTHPGRRDAGLELIGKALGGLEQLHIRQSCSAGRVDTLALDNVAGEGGTLYVVGDQKETASLRHALTEAVTTDQPGLTVVE
jgi:hypothetical protein